MEDTSLTTIDKPVKGEKPLARILHEKRAKIMLQMSLAGSTQQAIMEHFRVSRQTVQRSLEWAIKEGAVEEIEQKFIEELAPKALRVFNNALDEAELSRGQIDVARDVVDKIFKLSERFNDNKEKNTQRGLEAYFAEKRLRIAEAHGKYKSDNGDTNSPETFIEAIPTGEEGEFEEGVVNAVDDGEHRVQASTTPAEERNREPDEQDFLSEVFQPERSTNQNTVVHAVLPDHQGHQ